MTKDIRPIIHSLLDRHGDWRKNIPPGAVFATIHPREAFDEAEDISHLPYPPIIPDSSGCVFDPDTREVMSIVWGRAEVTQKGLRIRPAWRMSRDKMLLRIELDHADFEGDTVTVERLRTQLPTAIGAIENQFDLGALAEGLEESARTGRSVVVTVAEGAFPGEGRDARLELTFKPGNQAGTLRDDGSMDFRERAELHAVNEGDELGRLHPAVAGDFGYDLYGNPIKPADVERVSVNSGQGVTVSMEEDVTVYTAARTGVARFVDNSLEVVDLLEIPGDVDYQTGNIRAQQGSIHIKGDVKSGFVVECSGDVVIDGLVEEADVIAGGLVVAGGVIMNGANVIKAEGDVSAHYFRNARIEAGGDVTADQELALCTVVAGGKVSVLGEAGIISGGHVISGDDIHASVIGNKACLETCVEIRMPSTVEDNLNAGRREFTEELKRLDRAIGVDFDLSNLMSAPEEDRRILAELIKVRNRLQAELRQMDESRERVLEEARMKMADKRIIADRKTYCGTTTVICGKAHAVKSDLESPSFRLDVDSQEIVWG